MTDEEAEELIGKHKIATNQLQALNRQRVILVEESSEIRAKLAGALFDQASVLSQETVRKIHLITIGQEIQ